MYLYYHASYCLHCCVGASMHTVKSVYTRPIYHPCMYNEYIVQEIWKSGKSDFILVPTKYWLLYPPIPSWFGRPQTEPAIGKHTHNSLFFSFTQHCRSTCSYFDVFIRNINLCTGRQYHSPVTLWLNWFVLTAFWAAATLSRLSSVALDAIVPNINLIFEQKSFQVT